jgi:hypothetical protein
VLRSIILFESRKVNYVRLHSTVADSEDEEPRAVSEEGAGDDCRSNVKKTDSRKGTVI